MNSNFLSRIPVLVLVLALPAISSQGQDLARFTVKAKPGAGVTPLAIPFNLSGARESIAVFESGHPDDLMVPSQLEPGNQPLLWILYDHGKGDREYVIRRADSSADSFLAVSFHKTEQGLTLLKGGKPVLTYNHSEVFPPEGTDMKFRRSAFIHPLWSPGGEILTRIQPPDHYHHYGIWNPWTKTRIDGREVDFWNLLKGEGTVKFAGYLEVVEGEAYAGMKVFQEHVYFSERGREKMAMGEIWDVRVWASDIPGITLVDLTSALNTPLETGILLDAYRYGGGIGYRATGRWHKDNSSVLTSEGLERSQADGTSARWCIVEGESDGTAGRSGILFMSHPSNQMHPEPMRVWPPDANGGRGDIFFEFCPIRHHPWQLEQGKTYALKYRLILFDGVMSPADAEKYWQAFAQAPCITWLAP